MAIEIVSFQENYWDRLQRFIHARWKENHPVCRKSLFYWQYRGGGACKIAIDGDEIIGFLGAIPGKYALDGKILNGAALAIWIVLEKYRNSGLGILLLDEVEKENECVICLGVNKSVVKFYQMRDYQYLDRLNRYTVPLNERLYEKLIRGKVGGWRIDFGTTDPLAPSEVSAEMAAGMWKKSVAQNPVRFTMLRDEDFWRWRYLKSAGFEYMLFTDGDNLLVGRFDTIEGAEEDELNDKTVFRIIELVGGSSLQGTGCARFVQSVLLWAKKEGAILADFQCSSGMFGKVLYAAGFKMVNSEHSDTNIPAIFTPPRYDIPPINLVIKLPGDTSVDFGQTCFVKSDGDMDRPVR